MMFPSAIPIQPPMHETFAIAAGGTRLSPAAESFVDGITTHIGGPDLGLEGIA